MKIWALHDSKADAYLTPYFTANEHLAIRAFERAAMNPDQTMHTHPEDFTLYELGEWDEQNAKLAPLEMPRGVINGRQLPFWAQEK